MTKTKNCHRVSKHKKKSTAKAKAERMRAHSSRVIRVVKVKGGWAVTSCKK